MQSSFTNVTYLFHFCDHFFLSFQEHRESSVHVTRGFTGIEDLGSEHVEFVLERLEILVPQVLGTPWP